MFNAQAFVSLSMFLADAAKRQCRTNLSGISRHGGITCWPETIHYLLRTYATPFMMREALKNLTSIRKSDEELEESYRKHLNRTIHRWSITHQEDEKCHCKLTEYRRPFTQSSPVTNWTFCVATWPSNICFSSLLHNKKMLVTLKDKPTTMSAPLWSRHLHEEVIPPTYSTHNLCERRTAG